MSQILALIHTSQVFLNVETMMKEMFAEIMPEVRLINIMDDSLLPDVMATQKISNDIIRRMSFYVMAAEATGADAVLSLCSSLGPAVDVAKRHVNIPVIKIDDAHAEKAVREANRIGVMATVATTLAPTVALIREKAAAANKTVTIEERLVNGAFQILMRGEKDKHDAMVLDTARELAAKVDLILFAQASMTRLAPAAAEATGLPILTSPRLAIQYTKRVLDDLKAKKASLAAAGR